MMPLRSWSLALAALPLLLWITPLRQLLESRMLPHMLVELPLLFIAGWALARALGPRARLPAAIDAHGLTLAATCTIAQLDRLELPSGWNAAPLVGQCCRALLGSFKIWNVATVGGIRS